MIPKISVVVPCYNVEQYVSRALDSLVNQTLKDIEIICVDDKSTDNTLDVLKSYAKKDKRIKIIALSKNSGVSVARNKGEESAKAKYLGFVDPDDYVDLDFYEKLYLKIIDTNADFVVSNIKVTELSGKTYTFNNWLNKVEQNKLNFNYTLWCALYDIDFLRKNKIQNPVGIITGQDAVFCVMCAVLSKHVLIAPEAFYNYIRRKDSLFTQYLSDNKIISRIKAIKAILNFLNKVDIDSDSYIKVFASFFNQCLDLFQKNTKHSNRLELAETMIWTFDNHKYKEWFEQFDVFKYLFCHDPEGLCDYLSTKRQIEKSCKKYVVRLFRLLPVMVIKRDIDNTDVRVLGIPVFNIKSKR